MIQSVVLGYQFQQWLFYIGSFPQFPKVIWIIKCHFMLLGSFIYCIKVVLKFHDLLNAVLLTVQNPAICLQSLELRIGYLILLLIILLVIELVKLLRKWHLSLNFWLKLTLHLVFVLMFNMIKVYFSAIISAHLITFN